jgi:hypothetical protein
MNPNESLNTFNIIQLAYPNPLNGPEHVLNMSTRPMSRDLFAYAALLVDEDLAGRDQEL